MKSVIPKTKNPPSNEHLEWLVSSRSRNQVSALKIRKLMVDYEKKIKAVDQNDSINDDLVSAVFSLWRAVFLSDLVEGTEHVFDDKLKFMDELIANNAINYVQDKNCQEWSFTYYMYNAQFRLEDLNKMRKDILPDADYTKADGLTDKGWWEHHQKALEVAIDNFERLVSDGSK